MEKHAARRRCVPTLRANVACRRCTPTLRADVVCRRCAPTCADVARRRCVRRCAPTLRASLRADVARRRACRRSSYLREKNRRLCTLRVERRRGDDEVLAHFIELRDADALGQDVRVHRAARRPRELDGLVAYRRLEVVEARADVPVLRSSASLMLFASCASPELSVTTPVVARMIVRMMGDASATAAKSSAWSCRKQSARAAPSSSACVLERQTYGMRAVHH